MITKYRPAYYTAPRASSFAGRSIDTKPVDVANGSIYEEIDTGRIYTYDAENAVWHENPQSGGGGGGGTGDMKKAVYDKDGVVATAGGITNYVNAKDTALQDQIDALGSISKGVADVVGTYAELDAYDTTKLEVGDIINVLSDSTHDNANTYYRWTGAKPYVYIGTIAPYYTKTQTDDKLDDIHSIPAGGTTGQVIKKVSGTDYDVEWGDSASKILATGVLVGDGTGDVTGRPFDTAPTVDSDNMLTSGATYAAYSNVLLVADNKIKAWSGADQTDDAKSALGIVNVAVLTGVLPAGNTTLGLTDSHVTDDVTIEVYTDKYGVAPKSVTVANNTVSMVFDEQDADLNVRVDLGNVTWTTPVQPTDQGDMRKANYDAQGEVATAGGIPDYVKAKLDELKLDLGSIASIKVVDTQPTNPVRNTLYYIGTASPYQVELYANGEWYDMGTTDADLTDYAKTVDVDAALELKQDKLTTAQLDAVNSGITVAKVETYDGYSTGKADVGLGNVTDAVFKDKVENCGLTLPVFEYRDCTVSNKLSSVTITNAKQCKLNDKLYYIVFNVNTTGLVSSGETRICRITSLPSLTAASSVTPISVIWNGSWSPISAFISSGKDLYIRSNNSLVSNFTLSFSGLVMYK